MNNINNNWQVKSLGEVAEFINGRAFKPEEWGYEGLPIIRIQNLTGFSNVYNYYNGVVNNKNLVKRDDILISWSASLGVYVWGGGDAVLNQHIFKVELKNNIDRIFFFYLVKTKIDEMISNVHGSTMKHITKGRFDNIKVKFPPLPIQKQIAEILEQADKAKQKRKEASKLTDEFLQSVFFEMFGDPIKNPKGWEIKKIKELVSIPLQNGAYFTQDKYTNERDEGIEMVHMADAFYETVHTGGLKKVIVDESEKLKYELRNNDILIARRSLTIEGAAKACLVKVDEIPLIYESSFIRIRVNEQTLSPVFIFHFLSNARARKAYVQKYITSSTISGINQSNLAEVDILIPPFSLQQQFAEIVNKTEVLKEKQKQSEQELENLFQSLMQKAFKGELV